MGLLDFVKSAGEKLGLGDDKPERPAAKAPQAPGAAEVKKLHERRLAAALARAVGELKLDVDELGVRVDEDVATVTGKVKSQADREKVVLAVGNTRGIARVDDRLEVEKKEPEATMYTVKSGDSLSKIAKQHYGNAMKYPVIFEANKPMLKDPDKIYPGQVLRIPPLEG